MPCLYSLKTMYRRLPFIILLSILAVFALRASVVAPSILVQNYSVDDYKASCQNWDLAVSYHGILYVANNSGLVTLTGIHGTHIHYRIKPLFIKYLSRTILSIPKANHR